MLRLFLHSATNPALATEVGSSLAANPDDACRIRIMDASPLTAHPIGKTFVIPQCANNPED